jgi:hypothetical protein
LRLCEKLNSRKDAKAQRNAKKGYAHSQTAIGKAA